MTSLSHQQWMELHIGTLYRLDGNGRLCAINEAGYPPAPRFYLGRTTEGNSWRFSADLSNDIVEAIDKLCRAEAIATDLAPPPQSYQAIHKLLEQPVTPPNEYRGPAYWIPQNDAHSSNATLIDDTNAHLLQAHFSWLLEPTLFSQGWPVAVVAEGDKAVSVCFCSRIPGRATEAGLNTMEGFGGKGYAAAAVTCWANELWRRGILPLYSTSWANLASQRVAHKVGAIQYGEDWNVD